MKNPRIFQYSENSVHGSFAWEMSTEDLWNISLEVLTELSKRDNNYYTVKVERLSNQNSASRDSDTPKLKAKPVRKLK
tara:strand:+ start:243 stop:476 length:234 start_codon:yes stop_codon:yes gene_type:complete